MEPEYRANHSLVKDDQGGAPTLQPAYWWLANLPISSDWLPSYPSLAASDISHGVSSKTGTEALLHSLCCLSCLPPSAPQTAAPA